MDISAIGRPLHPNTFAAINNITRTELPFLTGFTLGDLCNIGPMQARHIVSGHKEFLGVVRFRAVRGNITNIEELTAALGEDEASDAVRQAYTAHGDPDSMFRTMSELQPLTLLTLYWASGQCYKADDATAPDVSTWLGKANNRNMYQHSCLLQITEQEAWRETPNGEEHAGNTKAGQELARFVTDVRAPGLLQHMSWEIKDGIEDLRKRLNDGPVRFSEVAPLLKFEALRVRGSGTQTTEGIVYPLFDSNDNLGPVTKREYFTISSVPWLVAAWKTVENPAYMQLLNMLPPVEGREHRMLSNELQDNMLSLTKLVTLAQKWALDQNSWGLDLLARRLFSTAIDFAAYATGFMAATLAGGYHSATPIILKNIGMGTDGSSRAHPDCGIWRPGAVVSPLQWRGVIPLASSEDKATNVTWAFFKGIVVPDEQCVDTNGNPAIWVDRAVLKADCKNWKVDESGRASKTNGMPLLSWLDTHQMNGLAWFSIINKWDRPGEFRWGFEVLENVKDNEATRGIVYNNVNQAFAKLSKGGVSGLLGMVASTDSDLKMMITLLDKINGIAVQHGRPDLRIEPLEVGRIKEAATEKLGRALYTIAQGSGATSRQYVMVMDSSIPRGHCVINGYKPGTAVATFRYPIVLAQGLQILHTMKPQKHHMVRGKIVPFTVFLNPLDAVEKFLGDDDGDVLAVTSDVEAVELFKHRLDDHTFMIEPKGVKHNWATLSPEGLQYIRTDPRGPVGQMTVHRSGMLALTASFPELAPVCVALSLAVQEAIDQAKRNVQYSDYALAANPHNWALDKQGRLWFKRPMVENGERTSENPEDWENILMSAANYEPGIMPEGLISKWLREIMKSKNIRGTVLPWRDKRFGSVAKRIIPNSWKHIEEGNPGYNLVHYAFNASLDAWNEISNQFNFDRPTRSLSSVLTTLLDYQFPGQGWHSWTPRIAATWKDYKQNPRGGMSLRSRAGFNAYGKAWNKILESGFDIEEQGARAAVLNANLNAALSQLTVHELIEVFFWEAQDARDIMHHESVISGAPRPVSSFSDDEIAEFKQKGAPNLTYGIRAISFPGSPIMSFLDIKAFDGCDYLQSPETGVKLLSMYGDFMMVDQLGMKLVNGAWVNDNSDPTIPQRRAQALAIKKALVQKGADVSTPVARLKHIATTDANHADEEAGRFDPTGERILHLHECKDCMKLLQDEFVRRQRLARSPHTEWLMRVISSLNQARDTSCDKFKVEWNEWATRLEMWPAMAYKTGMVAGYLDNIHDVDMDNSAYNCNAMQPFERLLWDIWSGEVFVGQEGLLPTLQGKLKDLAMRTGKLLGDANYMRRWQKATNPDIDMVAEIW